LNQVITAADIGSGLLTFVPVANQSASPYDSFDFEVGDGNDFSAADYTLTINVIPVNDPPVSNSLTITIDEDITHIFGTVQFTSGYNDPEGDPFASIRVTQLPSVGTLLLNGIPVTLNQVVSAADIISGLLTFVPLPGQSGSPYDNFDFEVGDGSDFSVVVYTLTINVNPVNDSPLAVDDNVPTAEETGLAVDVYSNDNLGDIPTFISNVDGITTQGGTAVINNNGTPANTSDDFIDYLPPTGFNGTDTFTYTIEDVDGESSAATVTVTVTPVNDSPTAVDDAGATAEDASTTIDVLPNDDLGDTPTSISSVDATTSQGGSAVINNNGTPGDPTDDFIDYTPAANFNGTDTFTYTIQDNDGETSTATVTVTVTGINDTPLAVDDNASTGEDITVTIDVVANDNRGDVPTAIITVDGITTEGGTTVINNNGTPADVSDDFIDFTPANGFIGTDTFSYTIEDIDGERSTATVTVDISLSPNTLIIYKGFSPNGDGSNDEWIIDGILFYPNNQVQVFNRWGNLVYQANGYDNQSKVWFGQSNEGWIVGDNALPDGTYFYMVDPGDGNELRSGYVMLKR
jgi:gliding motility-associated-like protein